MPHKSPTIPDLSIFALRSDDIKDMAKYFIECVENGKTCEKSEVIIKVIFLD